MNKTIYVLVFLVLLPFLLSWSNIRSPDMQKKITISGHVRDKENGEMLAGVTIFDNYLKQGTSTNAYGFYSLTIPAGSYDLQFSYIGYQTIIRKDFNDNNITIDIALEAIEKLLGEVVVEGTRPDDNVRATEMSLVKLDIKTIRMIDRLHRFYR